MTSQYVTSSDGGTFAAVDFAEERRDDYKMVKININEALAGT